MTLNHSWGMGVHVTSHLHSPHGQLCQPPEAPGHHPEAPVGHEPHLEWPHPAQVGPLTRMSQGTFWPQASLGLAWGECSLRHMGGSFMALMFAGARARKPPRQGVAPHLCAESLVISSPGFCRPPSPASSLLAGVGSACRVVLMGPGFALCPQSHPVSAGVHVVSTLPRANFAEQSG